MPKDTVHLLHFESLLVTITVY